MGKFCWNGSRDKTDGYSTRSQLGQIPYLSGNGSIELGGRYFSRMFWSLLYMFMLGRKCVDTHRKVNDDSNPSSVGIGPVNWVDWRSLGQKEKRRIFEKRFFFFFFPDRTRQSYVLTE